MKTPEQLDQPSLLKGLKALARGDFTVSMPGDAPGMAGEIGRAFNEAVRFAAGRRRNADPGAAGSAKKRPFANRKILVVDDDVRSLFAIRSMLEEKGAQVHIAENGPQCLKVLLEHPMDLVILDLMMPGMQGDEVMKHIRNRPRLKSLPIIVVTAKAMTGDRERCLDAGASDYISKPVDNERLISILRFWLEGRKKDDV